MSYLERFGDIWSFAELVEAIRSYLELRTF